MIYRRNFQLEISLFYFKVTIAIGNVSAVAKSIENALGKAVPVLIGFLASLLGIGGLADKVLNVIRKIRQRIENAIVKFWTFVKGKAGKLLSKIGVGKKVKDDGKSNTKTAKNNEKLEDSEVGKVINFSADGELHRLWIVTKGDSVEVMVASTTMSVIDRLKKWESEIHALPKEEQARAKVLLSEAKSQYLETSQDAKETDKALNKAKKRSASNDEIKKAKQLDDKVEDKEKRLSHTLQQLFSIFGEGNELKYIIKKITYVENGKVKLEGKYDGVREQMQKFVASLPELEKKGGNQRLRKELVSKGSTAIRKWEVMKGAIYSPFVEDYQEALKQMKENIKAEYIITTETGGSLLGDVLTKGTDIENKKILKTEAKPDLDDNGVQKKNDKGNLKYKTHKTQQPEDIVKYIHKVMKGQKNEAVTINIVETMVSGSSISGLITNGITALLNNNEYPNLKIKLHLMQETIGENVDNRRDSVINTVNSEIVDVANKVILYFNRTRYILGEDVGEQSQYNHREPVILFKGSDASLAAYSIIPQEGTSTRSIIIGLAQGEFNGKLPGVL